jgi:hypothetical protein
VSLEEDIARFLTGGKHGAGVPGVGETLEEIKRSAGSGRKAAKVLGIGETTWRRWYAKGKMPAYRRPLITSTLRMVWLDAARAERLKKGDITITTVGPKSWANRKLTGRNLKFSSDMGNNVIREWVQGNDRGAAKEFVAGIGDEWYRKTFFGTWMQSGASAGAGSGAGSGAGDSTTAGPGSSKNAGDTGNGGTGSGGAGSGGTGIRPGGRAGAGAGGGTGTGTGAQGRPGATGTGAQGSHGASGDEYGYEYAGDDDDYTVGTGGIS